MGFSTSAATVLIFMGILLSIGIMFPALEGSFEDVSDALDDRDERMLDQRNTDIQVSNVTYNATADTLTVDVDNTGAISLGVEETDILLDGEIQTGYATSVDGVADRSLWAPGETLTVELSDVTSKPNRLKVVTETGIAKVEVL